MIWDSYKDGTTALYGLCFDEVIGTAERWKGSWIVHITGMKHAFRCLSMRDARKTLAAHGSTDILQRVEVMHVHTPFVQEESTPIKHMIDPQRRQLLRKLARTAGQIMIEQHPASKTSWKKGTARKYRSN